MDKVELKKIAEELLDTFNKAGEDSIKLYEDGLKIEIKKDGSPVSNGDLRVNNLIHLFGNVFDFIDCGLDFKVGKKQYLLDRYSGKDYYWIEDSVDHAESGRKIGLKSIIMDHPYNKEWDGPRVKNWKQIYEIINDTTY